MLYLTIAYDYLHFGYVQFLPNLTYHLKNTIRIIVFTHIWTKMYSVITQRKSMYTVSENRLYFIENKCVSKLQFHPSNLLSEINFQCQFR